MKKIIFKKLINFVAFFYEKIFHEKMSDNTKEFVKNLSYIGVGTFIATIFTFTFTILAGRILGPSEFGEFALVESIAMFLYIPMLLGFDTAMVKYNSEKENLERRQKIISTTYVLVSISIIVMISVYYLFSTEISKAFSVSVGLFYLSIIFATLYVVYTLTTGTLRSLHEMKKLAVFRPIYSIVLLSSFLIFIFINFISFRSMVFSMCLAYGVTGGIILVLVRKYIRFKFDKMWARQIVGYGAFAIIGGISFVFYSNIDKILINKFMAVADVGIYKAYNHSFLAVITLSIGIFITVFFPVSSRCKNKNILFRKINKIIPFIIVLGLPVIVGVGSIVLMLYGAQYAFDLELALLFGIAGICICIYSAYTWLMNAVGIKGIKLTSFAAIILALTNIFLNIWLIPLIGIKGAISATIIAYIVYIFIIISKRRYFCNSEAIQS